jgi:hypothetical protein
LGQSFLGSRLLCRHSGFRCGYDLEVCEVPRASGATREVPFRKMS